MQNYLHIIDLYDCLLQIFVVTFLFPMSFFLEYVELQSYQIMSYFNHSHTKPSNVFQLICAHQDMPYPLF